jgi:hypothetical protein
MSCNSYHPNTTIQSRNRYRRSGSGINQQTTPCTYQEDIGKKDQGRASLDEGSTLLEPDKDGPANVAVTTPTVGKDGGTCKTPCKQAIPIIASAILIPSRPGDTSVRLDYGGRLDDAPTPVQGHFGQRVLIETPACRLRRLPSDGMPLGGREWGGVSPPPLPHLHPPPHHDLLKIQAGREFPPPRALATTRAALWAHLPCLLAYNHLL